MAGEMDVFMTLVPNYRSNSGTWAEDAVVEDVALLSRALHGAMRKSASRATPLTQSAPSSTPLETAHIQNATRRHRAVLPHAGNCIGATELPFWRAGARMLTAEQTPW